MAIVRELVTQKDGGRKPTKSRQREPQQQYCPVFSLPLQRQWSNSPNRRSPIEYSQRPPHPLESDVTRHPGTLSQPGCRGPDPRDVRAETMTPSFRSRSD